MQYVEAQYVLNCGANLLHVVGEMFDAVSRPAPFLTSAICCILQWHVLHIAVQFMHNIYIYIYIRAECCELQSRMLQNAVQYVWLSMLQNARV